MSVECQINCLEEGNGNVWSKWILLEYYLHVVFCGSLSEREWNIYK